MCFCFSIYLDLSRFISILTVRKKVEKIHSTGSLPGNLLGALLGSLLGARGKFPGRRLGSLPEEASWKLAEGSLDHRVFVTGCIARLMHADVFSFVWSREATFKPS